MTPGADHMNDETEGTPRPDVNDETTPEGGPVRPWRNTEQRSVRKDFLAGLGAEDFGDRIILFGAALLLSVLPLIILLNALASRRIDDDISLHLGLNRQGAHVVEGLFRPSSVSFDFGVLVALVLSLAGTVAVARSVQVIYERAFAQPSGRGMANVLRCFVWVVVVAGLLVADGATSRPLRDAPAGPVLLALANLAALTLFFWWSAHFLLAGREPWRRLWSVALATGLFWIGLGVFASLYFSSTLVSDSRLYGAIGVVFTLVTWFIAMGAVITLGAVVGVLWLKRRAPTGRSSAGE